jgi:spore coat protein U-like protein
MKALHRVFARVVLPALMLGLAPQVALAAYSCSMSVTGISAVYDPLTSTPTDSSGTFTLSCTRASSDSSTLYVDVKASQGLYVSGSSQNRAQIVGGTTRILYDLYRTSARTGSSQWKASSSSDYSVSINFGTALSASRTMGYYFRAPAAQVVAVGSYADTVTPTAYLRGTSTQLATVAIPIDITVVGACQISSSPGTVALSYTSFQSTSSTASTSFAVKCVSGNTYSMSLDATSGTLQGLNYSLAITPSGTQTGSGSPQSATITATIAANQGGTCSSANCTASRVHTLTITY